MGHCWNKSYDYNLTNKNIILQSLNLLSAFVVQLESTLSSQKEVRRLFRMAHFTGLEPTFAETRTRHPVRTSAYSLRWAMERFLKKPWMTERNPFEND
jgi:hypothetical protein